VDSLLSTAGAAGLGVHQVGGFLVLQVVRFGVFQAEGVSNGSSPETPPFSSSPL